MSIILTCIAACLIGSIVCIIAKHFQARVYRAKLNRNIQLAMDIAIGMVAVTVACAFVMVGTHAVIAFMIGFVFTTIGILGWQMNHINSQLRRRG